MPARKPVHRGPVARLRARATTHKQLWIVDAFIWGVPALLMLVVALVGSTMGWLQLPFALLFVVLAIWFGMLAALPPRKGPGKDVVTDPRSKRTRTR